MKENFSNKKLPKISFYGHFHQTFDTSSKPAELDSRKKACQYDHNTKFKEYMKI